LKNRVVNFIARKLQIEIRFISNLRGGARAQAAAAAARELIGRLGREVEDRGYRERGGDERV
jgi:hypothetical protein